MIGLSNVAARDAPAHPEPLGEPAGAGSRAQRQRMVRYAVFLRGVSPQNLRMPIFADALGAAGLAEIRTVRSSGNAVFEAQRQASGALEQRIERALERVAGRRFTAFVRSASELKRIVSTAAGPHPAGTKRIVVISRAPVRLAEALPMHRETWALLSASLHEMYGFYTPGPGASSLMSCLTRQYGDDFTTRTAETVLLCSALADGAPDPARTRGAGAS